MAIAAAAASIHPMAPGLFAEGDRTIEPPVAQHRCRQTKAKDAEQPQQQARPAHWIDRLPKQTAGQQGHQQGLRIDEYRTQARSGLAQAPSQ
jgi:hypothetical protein